ncbi:MAG: hypothetical protein AAF567_26495 [Actinomycetota bacterium]
MNTERDTDAGVSTSKYVETGPSSAWTLAENQAFAVGDIDGDGVDELVIFDPHMPGFGVITEFSYGDLLPKWSDSTDTQLLTWWRGGSSVQAPDDAGKDGSDPFSLELGSDLRFVLSDVDGDGVDELCIVSGQWPYTSGFLAVLEWNGSRFAIAAHVAGTVQVPGGPGGGAVVTGTTEIHDANLSGRGSQIVLWNPAFETMEIWELEDGELKQLLHAHGSIPTRGVPTDWIIADSTTMTFGSPAGGTTEDLLLVEGQRAALLRWEVGAFTSLPVGDLFGADDAGRAVELSAVAYPVELVFADLSGDGKDELLVVDCAGRLAAFTLTASGFVGRYQDAPFVVGADAALCRVRSASTPDVVAHGVVDGDGRIARLSVLSMHGGQVVQGVSPLDVSDQNYGPHLQGACLRPGEWSVVLGPPTPLRIASSPGRGSGPVQGLGMVGWHGATAMIEHAADFGDRVPAWSIGLLSAAPRDGSIVDPNPEYFDRLTDVNTIATNGRDAALTTVGANLRLPGARGQGESFEFELTEQAGTVASELLGLAVPVLGIALQEVVSLSEAIATSYAADDAPPVSATASIAELHDLYVDKFSTGGTVQVAGWQDDLGHRLTASKLLTHMTSPRSSGFGPWHVTSADLQTQAAAFNEDLRRQLRLGLYRQLLPILRYRIWVWYDVPAPYPCRLVARGTAGGGIQWVWEPMTDAPWRAFMADSIESSDGYNVWALVPNQPLDKERGPEEFAPDTLTEDLFTTIGYSQEDFFRSNGFDSNLAQQVVKDD